MTSLSTQVLSIKRKVLAAVATLTMVCGVSAAATDVASAASPQCAEHCISVFSSELGTYDQLNFVEAVLGDGEARIGQPVGLKRANKFDPTQDIKPDAPVPMATVSDFFAVTSPSSTPRPTTSAARSRCTCRATKSRVVGRCRCRPAACSSSPTTGSSGRGSSGALGSASCRSKSAVLG